MWAIIANILKVAGKKALENAASNALGHMGGLGVALEKSGAIGNILGSLTGSGGEGGSQSLEGDRTVAHVGGRDVKLSQTKPPEKGMDWGKVSNFMTDLAANTPRQPSHQPSAPLEDDYEPLKLDEAGKKVLLSRMDEYGKKLTEREALDSYRRTGTALGKFATDYEADEYARKLEREKNYYGF